MNQEPSQEGAQPRNERNACAACDDTIQFLASLPPITSAVMRSGAGNGMRVQLDIPESEMANAIRIQLWDRKVLEVTIRVIDPKEIKEIKKINGNQTQTDEDERESAGESGGSAKARTPVRRAAKQRV